MKPTYKRHKPTYSTCSNLQSCMYNKTAEKSQMYITNNKYCKDYEVALRNHSHRTHFSIPLFCFFIIVICKRARQTCLTSCDHISCSILRLTQRSKNVVLKLNKFNLKKKNISRGLALFLHSTVHVSRFWIGSVWMNPNRIINNNIYKWICKLRLLFKGVG